MTVQTDQKVLTVQNRRILRIAIQILLLVSHVNTLSWSSFSEGTPVWRKIGNYGFDNYVSDGSPVTSITVNQDPSGPYLYGLVVNGLSSGASLDGYILKPCPAYDTGFIQF